MGSQPKNPTWFRLGDPLRGLAALGVLLFHVATWTVLNGTDWLHAATLGFAGRILFNLDAGVFLFFLLSGYLIGRPFASAFVQQTAFPELGRYVRRRFMRLAPGVAAATVLAVIVFGRHFTRGTVHFWTLSAEACFYAALPLAALAALPLTSRVRALRLRGALWIAACALIALASIWFRGRGHQHSLPAVGFAFAPGLALAAAQPLAETFLRAHQPVARTAARVLLVAALAAAVGYFAVARSSDSAHSLLAVAACGAVLTAALIRDWAQLPAWRAIDNAPLQWLGERSYSLYLFHLAVVSLAVRLTAHAGSPAQRVVLVALIVVPVSLVAADLGYRLVERPFMRSRRTEPAVDGAAAVPVVVHAP